VVTKSKVEPPPLQPLPCTIFEMPASPKTAAEANSLRAGARTSGSKMNEESFQASLESSYFAPQLPRTRRPIGREQAPQNPRHEGF